MRSFLKLYTDPLSNTYGKWRASSIQAAVSLDRGTYCARQLRILARTYILDRKVLPNNPYGRWSACLLTDEDLANEVTLYLQELGTNITAEKLVLYLSRDDVMERHSIDRIISTRTARRYLNILGYRFHEAKKGQYKDGHEREDVTIYRDTQFIPKMKSLLAHSNLYDRDGKPLPPSVPNGKQVIIWYHDETIFYAHDRRRKAWYHKDSAAKLGAKGEGVTLMIADFVSAEFGWLASPDGESRARREFRPGKNKDGYFTAEDIQAQVKEAMDIVQEWYPGYEHVFVYDNTTHLKRPEGALSARKMLKGPSGNFFVEVTERDADGKPVYRSDGKLKKVKKEMGPGKLPNGQDQPLYFPKGHKKEGQFKGMEVILQERGINTTGKKAECNKNFRCPPTATDCCLRRILYNQPDFVEVESILETTCKERGVQVVFLPKFHCELNPIEQCWGYAKRVYRFYPESSKEDDLRRNALESLDQVPLLSIRRFTTRTHRFMDAYARGLNGRQAAWATRKYRGHRVLPTNIMQELLEESIV
ncbi:hypothetical protein K435DRAFT_660226 [Dendrothele bispora CBS 962.96]|uniref:Tc1-like transposase DDE domain-containing protein n=1 Tax=Dendrothele bispora (strain CBS 962.96) TaxID=1314807 RepID=A0A4S8MA30_DENBC|nr:hypothetical protein K435DRAFT_660226 [Dendrothele bispora CBS 962.96]